MPENPELTAAIAACNALDAAISDVDRLARNLRQKLGGADQTKIRGAEGRT